MLELKEALASLEVLEPQEQEHLSVYGLRWQRGEGPDYATLDEALESKQLEVTEVSESGSVPQLKVVNRGDTMVFIMAGEELIGAKQNRVLNVSMMVDSKSEQPIPVSCVEAGRWAYRSARFTSQGTSSPSSLRSLMSKQIHSSYGASGTPRSNQGAVWGEIQSKLKRMGSFSGSSELHQVYRDYKTKLDAILAELVPPDGCCGAAFASGDRILGLDLFDKPATLHKMWPKLVRGYAVDALENKDKKTSTTSGDVREWLATVSKTKAERFKSPGLGDDVRFESGRVHGGALVVESNPIHVELFAEALQT